MFEKEIKFIADVNLNRIKGLGSFITFDKLVHSEIHPAIVKYISAELDYLIYEDRKKLLENSVFDYSGKEVAKHFNIIAQEIKKDKKISFEDIKKLILQAVSFNFNYLMRPKWSLSKLVYNETEVKNIEEINLSLNYVYFYDYIKNIFTGYVVKRKLISLSLTEFESILNKIDKEIFTSNPQKFTEFALHKISDFYNTGSTNKNIVPPLAVEVFLKEKNLTEQVIRLKKAFPGSLKQSINVDEIKKVIYSTDPIEIDIEPEEQKVDLKPETVENKEHEVKVAENSEPVKEEINEHEEINEKNITEEKHEQLEVEFEESKDEIKDADNKIDEVKKEELVKDDEIEEEVLEETEVKKENIVGEGNEEKEEIKIDEEDNEIKKDEIETLETRVPENKEEVSKEDLDLLQEELNLDVDTDSESVEDLLAFYESELESIDEDLLELDAKKKDEQEPLKKEELEDIFNFEEDNGEIKDVIDSQDEQKDIQVPDDSYTTTEDDVNKKEVEDLTKNLLEEEQKTKEKESDRSEIQQAEEKETGKQRYVKREKDIFDYMSNKDIEKIVSNVFNDDREDFANTMEKITECGNYEEATDILKSVFLTYRINPYSKEAVILTNSVSNYFDQG